MSQNPVPIVLTLDPANVSAEELATLADFTDTLEKGQLRTMLEHIIDTLTAGRKVLLGTAPAA